MLLLRDRKNVGGARRESSARGRSGLQWVVSAYGRSFWRIGACRESSPWINVRSHDLVGEVIIPQSSCEQRHLPRGIALDALQYFDEVGVRIHALRLVLGYQAVDDADVLCTDLRPCEQPIISSQCNGPDLALQVFVSTATSGSSRNKNSSDCRSRA